MFETLPQLICENYKNHPENQIQLSKNKKGVFVAEMGARYVGDIKTLCKLVHPQYGIITAVGKQHLETFKSLDNIINTKAELIGGLEEDGCCFLNGDDENCQKAIHEQNDEFIKTVQDYFNLDYGEAIELMLFDLEGRTR